MCRLFLFGEPSSKSPHNPDAEYRRHVNKSKGMISCFHFRSARCCTRRKTRWSRDNQTISMLIHRIRMRYDPVQQEKLSADEYRKNCGTRLPSRPLDGTLQQII